MVNALRHVNLENLWDKNKVCKNPHKGWYLHYYDNTIKVYGSRLAPDDYLEDFPGLNHIYLRLGWHYLEPEEGRFNWEIIDKEIKRWTEHGYRIAFRISCKETDPEQTYATPEWVKNAGAKGTLLTLSGKREGFSWEPDYGDPIFLEKLENFHKAFAERYDGKPWLEYVDIGSYGDWGEGHTAASSHKSWPLEVFKKHIDIYCRCYKNTLILINDDHIGWLDLGEAAKEDLLDYAVKNGLSLRDDGICVKWFSDTFGLSTLRSPEMFDRFWRNKPTDLELEHYHMTVHYDTWRKGMPLEAAIEESHATFVSFHGFAREWLSENIEVAKRLANRMGYWYFLKRFEAPEYVKGGESCVVKFVWENHGVAPAYHKYNLYLMLENENTGEKYVQNMKESENMKWMPGYIVGERCVLSIPEDLPVGNYKIKVALIYEENGQGTFLELPFNDEMKSQDNYYKVSQINII